MQKLIVGLYFPEYDSSSMDNGFIAPGLLDVLPVGDNVKFCRNQKELQEIDDNDVLYYVASVYTMGYNQFKHWAQGTDKTKIIVGGYHPTLCPEDFIDYSYKIIIGHCDNFWLSLKQEGQIVKGIVDYSSFPRYDLFKRITNISEKFFKSSLVTSMGCNNNCEFCCTPILSGNKLISKPLNYLEKEIEYLKEIDSKTHICMIQDENLLKQKDWEERLALVNKHHFADQYFLFCSADILADIDIVKKLKSFNVTMVVLGVEDIDVKYAKNLKIMKAIENLQSEQMKQRCTFIINPLDMINEETEQKKYEKMYEFLQIALPVDIHCNILAPYPHTRIQARFKDLIDVYDYDNYGRVELFIKDRVLANRVWDNMHKFELRYYNSEKYMQSVPIQQRLFSINRVHDERRFFSLLPLT